MFNQTGRVLIAALMLVSTGTALAKSSTAVSLSVDGKATPGQTINLHVILSGKHYVYGGGCTFYSGNINLSQDGTIINATAPTTLNSNVILSAAVPAPPGTGCYDADSGQWYAVKVYGDHTEYYVPFQLPAKTGNYRFTATFLGDGEANGSTSPDVNVSARYPVNPAVLDYLLSD